MTTTPRAGRRVVSHSTRPIAADPPRKGGSVRRSLLLLTILIALTAFAPRAQAKPGWWWNRVDNLQDPVEQESPNFFFCGGSAGPINCAFDPSTWVDNPTPCAWDVDDHIDISGSATLPRKATVTASFCTMSDGYDNYGGDDHSVEVAVGAPVDSLTVRLTS